MQVNRLQRITLSGFRKAAPNRPAQCVHQPMMTRHCGGSECGHYRSSGNRNSSAVWSVQHGGPLRLAHDDKEETRRAGEEDADIGLCVHQELLSLPIGQVLRERSLVEAIPGKGGVGRCS
jgi:hypothetical protein